MMLGIPLRAVTCKVMMSLRVPLNLGIPFQKVWKWQFEEGVFSHNKANRETYDRETYDKSWLASGGLSSNTVYIDRILNTI